MTRSEFGENLNVAWDTLKAHKVRSGLTLLGIVIGVTSVIAVASVIEGLNRFIQQKVEELGSGTYFISRFPVGTDPNRMPEKIRLRRYIEYDTATRLKQYCRAVESATTIGTRASFFGQSNEIRYGGERVQKLFVRGAEPAYIDVLPMFTMDQGRFVTATDEEHASQVVVIGAKIADSLFPRLNPLGKSVMLNGGVYEVVGVFSPKEGLFGGPGPDDFAIIPLSNFHKHNPDVKELAVLFTVNRGLGSREAMDEVTDAMRRVRRLRLSLIHISEPT